MKIRREFIKSVPLAMALAPVAQAFDERGSYDRQAIVGAWQSIHTLPFPPGSFRELLSFADGGVVHETNSFLNSISNLDFSMYGLPNSISAADGVGTWMQSHGEIQVTFRKLLFDGSHQNFGDLLVNGVVQISQSKLMANWHIQAVDVFDAVLADFGPATSQGSRIR